MKDTVIYHRADFDGLFCREIARKFLGYQAEYVGWDFGDPLVKMPDTGTVYILDLSPECLDAGQVATQVWNRIVWIDHHKSSIEKFQPPRWPPIPGYRIDGVAACRLAWQWFAGPKISGKECALEKQDFLDRMVDEPRAVQLAGEYDVWDKRNPEAEVFQFGLRSGELMDKHWAALLSDGGGRLIEELLQRGGLLQRYQRECDAQMMKRSCLVEFEGLRFLALNTARCNSLTFAAEDEPETGHDALMGFYWNGTGWNVSLYHARHRTDLDLSEIAVKHGGGGHRGACGFRVLGDELNLNPVLPIQCETGQTTK